MLIAVAAAVSLFYALQLPLCLAVVVEYSDRLRVGIGVGAFSLRGANRRAARHLKPPRDPSGAWMEKSGGFARSLHGAKYLYAHRLALRISIDGSLGSTDAARLAVCWGSAQALLDSLCAATDGRISGCLRPDFSSPHSRGTLRLTFAVRSGAAVTATLQAVGERISGKVKPWINTPLKA